MRIGIDLGGINIAGALVDEKGNIINPKSVPTLRERNQEDIITDIVSLIKDLIDSTDEKIISIGIGVPGVVDETKKIIYVLKNLNWTNVHLAEAVEKEVGITTLLDNDANLAAIAEYEYGSLKHVNTGILLTLGTGIGGGIILNKELYRGSYGLGFEVGHMIIGENFYDCNCGKHGCFETFSSATAIIKYCEMRLDAGVESKLSAYRQDMSAKVIFDLSKEEDELAVECVDRLVKYLARGIVNLIVLFDPELIAIGGGVSHAGEYLINKVKIEVKKDVFTDDIPHCDIVLAETKNDAGIIGAALLK